MLTIKNIESVTKLSYFNVYDWKIDNVTETYDATTLMPQYMFIVTKDALNLGVGYGKTHIFLLNRIVQSMSLVDSVYALKHTESNTHRYFDLERLKDVTNLLGVIDKIVSVC
jgi:hypothetical protein